MNAIKNITIGHTERLYKPVGYTMLANLVNIVPFCLSIEAIRIIFSAFDGSGQPLDTTRLWWIFGIMAVYMLVMALAERRLPWMVLEPAGAQRRYNIRTQWRNGIGKLLASTELTISSMGKREA